MKLILMIRCVTAAILPFVTSAAVAQTVNATDLVSAGALGRNHLRIDGMYFGAVGGSFASKTVSNVTAIGVSGGASDAEIDVGQGIFVGFNSWLNVTNFNIAFLFDGPEYGDVNEVAKVFLLGSNLSGRLIAQGPTSASWNFSDGTVSNISPATIGNAGVWNVDNPFGSATGSGLYFTALNGTPGAGCKNCSNQSDYSVLSVSAVPEPSTYALMLGGLLAVGGLVRRRKIS